MKKSVHLKTFFTHAIFAVCLACFSSTVNAQTIPELIFRNPVLISGTAGQDGAQYLFSNVATGLDAVLEIRGRSANNVVISSIDSTGIGWDKALQPVLGVPTGVGANQNWSVQFRLTFYDAGKNKKKKITRFYATGIDIDGDNGNLHEWVEMDKITKVTFSQINALSNSLVGSVQDHSDDDNDGSNYQIVGPTTNYTNIDTAATSVMATYQYDKKDQIDFSLGAATTSAGGTSDGVGMRMNSLWFKQFNLNPITLPIKLIDFTAKYTKPNVSLEWSTSQEHNFSHFIVERSTDGTNFSQTAIVFGAGESDSKIDYSYTDKDMNGRGGIIYYRLKQVDIDGRFDYSPVRMIKLGEEKSEITITSFPNPATNELHVTIPAAWQGKTIKYELVNSNGQLIKQITSNSAGQTQTIEVNDLEKGMYFIRVNCNGETAMQKIIKN